MRSLRLPTRHCHPRTQRTERVVEKSLTVDCNERFYIFRPAPDTARDGGRLRIGQYRYHTPH